VGAVRVGDTDDGFDRVCGCELDAVLEGVGAVADAGA